MLKCLYLMRGLLLHCVQRTNISGATLGIHINNSFPSTFVVPFPFFPPTFWLKRRRQSVDETSRGYDFFFTETRVIVTYPKEMIFWLITFNHPGKLLSFFISVTFCIISYLSLSWQCCRGDHSSSSSFETAILWDFVKYALDIGCKFPSLTPLHPQFFFPFLQFV